MKAWCFKHEKEIVAIVFLVALVLMVLFITKTCVYVSYNDTEIEVGNCKDQLNPSMKRRCSYDQSNQHITNALRFGIHTNGY